MNTEVEVTYKDGSVGFITLPSEAELAAERERFDALFASMRALSESVKETFDKGGRGE
jgi:hypothetical protein